MIKDPQKNSLIKLEAKLNKLEGSISVLQDGPEIVQNGSGSNSVIDNKEDHFVVPISNQNGTVNYVKFKRGVNPGVGKFLSPFPAVDFNMLETFEEASNLDSIVDPETGNMVYLNQDGKYANNALPYKRQSVIKKLNVKWAGEKIQSTDPYVLEIGSYSTISPNYQKPLSPDSSEMFQTGNLWIQQPIANLYNGDEVIWGLTSGSEGFIGDRTGRNMQQGLVGPNDIEENIPVYFGANTTGSSVSVFGSDTSQNRLLGSGSIRDNSSSRTYGSHFRPTNNTTLQSGTTVNQLGSFYTSVYNSKNIENSGKNILSTKRKTWSFQQSNQSPPLEDLQGITINKLRSSEYVSDIPPLKINTFASVSVNGNISTGLFDVAQPNYNDNLQKDFEGNISIPVGIVELNINNALTSSLSAKYKTFQYNFSGSFSKPQPESTFIPEESKIYIGSPVRLYFSDAVSGESGGTYYLKIIPRSFSKFKDLVLLTSRGQVFLKRDLGFSNEDFNNMHYLDFADERLFFAGENELTPQGSSRIQIKDIAKDSLVEIAGAVGIFDFTSNNSQIYETYALQYYNRPSMRRMYYNNNGMVAHSMGSDPYSYIVIGDETNPARDPGFRQSEGDSVTIFGYDLKDNIKFAVDKTDVGKFYFTAYNSQYGRPHVLVSRPRKIQNLVSNFSYGESLTSSNSYIFKNAESVSLNNPRTVPFVNQGLLKRYTIQPIATEEEINLQSIGFSQEGSVPILRYTDSYKTKTDAFGNGYVSDIPSEYIPYFNKTGKVDALFGSSMTIDISDQDEDNNQRVGNINQSLYGIFAKSPDRPINLNSTSPFGFAPYNKDDRNGIAYRAILGNLISRISSSWLWSNDLLYLGADFNLPSLPLPRIGGVNPLQTDRQPNSRYWQKDPLSAFPYIPQSYSLSITGSSMLNLSDSMMKYPSNFVYGFDKTTGLSNGFVDFDSGIVTQSLENNTKNKLHMLNSDIFLHQDLTGSQRLGLFLYSPNSNVTNSTVTSAATSSLAMNFIYDSIPKNSKISHLSNGFSSSEFEVIENGLTSGNRFFSKEDPIFNLEIAGPIIGFNNIISSSNNYAFACYTISDSEDLYNGKTFTSQSLYKNSTYSVPAFGTNVPKYPRSSFLISPISQSNTSNFPGIQSGSVSYINSRTALSESLNISIPTRQVQHYASNKFFIHPRGGLNYAVGPTDYYFGTAVQDNNSNRRQITKKLGLYIEHSTWQDTLEKSNGEDTLSPDVEQNYRILNGFPSYGIQGGNYSWIFHIQDMIPPMSTNTWISSSVESPPKLFSKTSNDGQDNGLRSNFYWNIPQCELNKSIFTSIDYENSTNREMTIQGTFKGITGPDGSVGSAIEFDDLVYNNSCPIFLRISEADDVDFEKKSSSFSGVDQYNGVFVPIPSNPSYGRDDLNIEGSLEILKNGEMAQPFKRLRVDLSISGSIPMTSILELAKLAVSFRPNSQIPDSIIEPSTSDNLTLNTWTPYPDNGLDNIVRFNTGEAFCFARVSSVCLYKSLNTDAGENFDPGSAIVGSVPYDPFSHDPDNEVQYIQYIQQTVNSVIGSVVTQQIALGYHSLLSFGESCSDFSIGDLTCSIPSDCYNININAYAWNRSIIDQGNSLNIINLAGSAIRSEKRSF